MLYVNPQISASFAGKDLAPGTSKRDEEVLRQYEQLFIYQMLKEMRKTVPDYGLVDAPEQGHFDEMMDDFLAGEMASSGQFGIAAQLADQLAIQNGAKSGAAVTAPGNFGLSLHPEHTGIRPGSDVSTGIPAPSPQRGIARYSEAAGMPR